MGKRTWKIPYNYLVTREGEYVTIAKAVDNEWFFKTEKRFDTEDDAMRAESLLNELMLFAEEFNYLEVSDNG